jgi:hypothetical protein
MSTKLNGKKEKNNLPPFPNLEKKNKKSLPTPTFFKKDTQQLFFYVA